MTAKMVPFAPLLDVVRQYAENAPIGWCGSAEQLITHYCRVSFVWRVMGCGCPNCMRYNLRYTSDVPRFTLAKGSVTEVSRDSVLDLLGFRRVRIELGSRYPEFRADILAAMP